MVVRSMVVCNLKTGALHRGCPFEDSLSSLFINLAGTLDNPVCTSTSLEGQITNAYPHVVMDRIGNGGGKTDPEDRLGHRQRVYVPVASEKFAEHQPTD